VASRLAKTAAIAEFLRRVTPAEVGLAVAYLSGLVRQPKTGIGYALVRDASPGSHAATPALTLTDVDRTLEEIAGTRGAGSAARRLALLSELFARATVDEADFLARLLVGELRQGALEGQMIEAVAAAADVPPADVRRAAMVGGGIAAVAASAMAQGASGLQRYRIALFQPLAPMLAQPAEDMEDAMSRIGTAAIEWKLDGARVQVHKEGDEVRIFSRTGKEVTKAAPEIVEVVRATSSRELILDGEAIALKADGAPYPFQETMSRFGRVQDIDAMRARMPLSVFFFDCLRRDDDDLVALAGA
jgi:DNA ligase-1